MTPRILIIGRNGQVAWELQRTMAGLGEVLAIDRNSNPAIDLLDSDSIRAVLRQIRPQLIINAAAYTAVDQAETEQDNAWQINAVAPGILAEVAAELDAMLIHYSTDYVFAGDANQPYGETDCTSPQGSYGESKLAGEQAVINSGCRHLVLRTAWVYGTRGKNFLLTMLRLMRERDTLGVVADQVGAPTWSRMIAELTAMISTRCISGNSFVPLAGNGIYHLTSAGMTSWHGFATAIRNQAIAAGKLPADNQTRVNPISTEEYPTPARRPAFSVLAGDKLFNDYGLRIPDWEICLELAMDDLPPG